MQGKPRSDSYRCSFIAGAMTPARCAILSFALSLALARISSAQGTASDADTSTSQSALTEVIVTAQKQNENLLKVPLSVTALGGNELQQMSVVTFNDLANHVPGLTLQDSGNGGVRPVLRGVSSFVGSPTVAIYVDDAPIQSQFGYEGTASGGSPEVRLLDVDHVEVLMGPQGTLYGGSAMGGAIKYVMDKPTLHGAQGSVRAEGSYLDSDTFGGEVAFAGSVAPVEGVFGASLSGLYRHDGGYIDQYDLATQSVINKNQNDQNTEAGRAAFLLVPAENWSAQLAVLYQRITFGAYNTYNSALGYPYMDNTQPENGSDTFYVPTLSINGKIGSFHLVSVTTYFDRDRLAHEDYSVALPNAIPPLAALVPILNHTDETTKNFSQELRLRYESETGRAGFVLGGFYFDSKLSEHQHTAGLPDESFLFFDQVSEVRDKEEAIFAEGYWRPWQPLNLTLGFRKSYLKSEFTEQPGQGPFANPPAEGERTDEPVTPKINVSYDLSPNGLVYAQAAKGFRTGQAAGPILSLCDAELIERGLGTEPGFGSDELWTYEVGGKGLLLDRTLQIVGSAYHTNWTRKPESILLLSCGTTVTANVGDVRINGAEFATTVLVSPRFTLDLDVAYTDAQYTNTSTTSGFSAGDPVPFVAKWAATASGNYRFNLFSWPWYARLDYVYRDKMPQGSQVPADRGTENAYSDAYNLFNIRVGAKVVKWDASVFVSNITNQHPIVSAYLWHPATLDADRITTIAPRAVGITVSRKF